MQIYDTNLFTNFHQNLIMKLKYHIFAFAYVDILIIKKLLNKNYYVYIISLNILHVAFFI